MIIRGLKKNNNNNNNKKPDRFIVSLGSHLITMKFEMAVQQSNSKKENKK